MSNKTNIKNLSFDHIHYRSSNLDITRKFYVDTMEGIELPPLQLGGNENVQIALGGVTLLFVLYPDDPIPEPVPAGERLGVYHIAFLVENCTEATEYYITQGATVAKAPFQPVPASVNLMVSFLEAPDGMWVELKQIIS
jgi:catechol 2,3-dioxygenase-like lactoylglutathione lyase family enzyme